MTDKAQYSGELAALVKLIKQEEAATSTATTQNLLDVVTKVITALSAGGIFWLVSTVSEIDKKVGENEIQRTNLEDKIINLKENLQLKIGEINNRLDVFTAQPRFIQQDFNTQITPVVDKVTQNTAKIAESLTLQKQSSETLIRHDARLDNIEQSVDRLKLYIKKTTNYAD